MTQQLTERQQFLLAISESMAETAAQDAKNPPGTSPGVAAEVPRPSAGSEVSSQGCAEAGKCRKTDWVALVQDAISSSPRLMVLRYLAPVLRVCAPSDIVAYRQHRHHYKNDPVFLSCYLCLLNSATREELLKVLNTPILDFLRYIRDFNEKTGINPSLVDLIRRTDPSRAYAGNPARDELFRVEPEAIGDGQGRTAAQELERLSEGA